MHNITGAKRHSLLTPLHSLLERSSIPFAWRTLLLVSAFFLVLVFNADHVRGQTPPDDPPPDLHADNPFFATFVPFGSSVDGRIDPSTDTDFFVFDLSDQPGPTDVWIYTTGDLDSFGALYDSSLDVVVYNDDSFIEGRFRSFQIRATLEPDVYFVRVTSWRRSLVGDYTLHVESTANPSDSVDAPTQLDLGSPVPGKLETRGEAHYFRFDLDEHTNLIISARNLTLVRFTPEGDRELVPIAPLDAIVTDADGAEVSVNIRPNFVGAFGEILMFGIGIRDDFAPGSYFLKVTTPADNYETTYPVLYTVNAIEDVAYTEFVEGCEDMTVALDDASIDDPLYACQWHLDQPSGEDVNVEPAWDQGITGEGVNVVVVDDGMDWTHEDLVDNVDSSLNHDYSDGVGIHHPYAHHGTAVTGLIAARDNDTGVRGVAPRATLYSHNLLAALATAVSIRLEDADIADAMSRDAAVTAVSNNSWGDVDGPGASSASGLWELAVENGVTRGNDGKGVFYVWAAGNGHEDGDDANLDGRANFYAVTAACAVNGSSAPGAPTPKWAQTSGSVPRVVITSL